MGEEKREKKSWLWESSWYDLKFQLNATSVPLLHTQKKCFSYLILFLCFSLAFPCIHSKRRHFAVSRVLGISELTRCSMKLEAEQQKHRLQNALNCGKVCSAATIIIVNIRAETGANLNFTIIHSSLHRRRRRSRICWTRAFSYNNTTTYVVELSVLYMKRENLW